MPTNEILKKIESILPEIRQYPSGEQVHILQYYMLYLLRDKSKKEILDVCCALTESGEKGIKIERKNSTYTENFTLNESIKNILSQFDVKVEEQAGDIQNLKLILACVCDLKNTQFPKISLDATVQEMFDQVINSLDPLTAENYLDQSVERSELSHKAALFDAMCEKYEQLNSYHESGLLLKDFSRLYLKNIRDQNQL